MLPSTTPVTRSSQEASTMTSRYSITVCVTDMFTHRFALCFSGRLLYVCARACCRYGTWDRISWFTACRDTETRWQDSVSAPRDPTYCPTPWTTVVSGCFWHVREGNAGLVRETKMLHVNSSKMTSPLWFSARLGYPSFCPEREMCEDFPGKCPQFWKGKSCSMKKVQ